MPTPHETTVTQKPNRLYINRESPSVARPATDARRPGAKSSQGGGLKLRSGYALPPFQATAARLTLIDAPVRSLILFVAPHICDDQQYERFAPDDRHRCRPIMRRIVSKSARHPDCGSVVVVAVDPNVRPVALEGIAEIRHKSPVSERAMPEPRGQAELPVLPALAE